MCSHFPSFHPSEYEQISNTMSKLSLTTFFESLVSTIASCSLGQNYACTVKKVEKQCYVYTRKPNKQPIISVECCVLSELDFYISSITIYRILNRYDNFVHEKLLVAKNRTKYIELKFV